MSTLCCSYNASQHIVYPQKNCAQENNTPFVVDSSFTKAALAVSYHAFLTSLPSLIYTLTSSPKSFDSTTSNRDQTYDRIWLNFFWRIKDHQIFYKLLNTWASFLHDYQIGSHIYFVLSINEYKLLAYLGNYTSFSRIFAQHIVSFAWSTPFRFLAYPAKPNSSLNVPYLLSTSVSCS